MYSTLFLSSNDGNQIPRTRLVSYSQFCSSGQKRSIQNYILKLLQINPKGLTCREISDISKIEVQSLTGALWTLEKSNKIIVEGIKRSSKSNRLVQIYVLNNSLQNEAE